MELKIKELDESKDELGELIAKWPDLYEEELDEFKDELGELMSKMSQHTWRGTRRVVSEVPRLCMKENSKSPRKDSTSSNGKSEFCHEEKLGELEGNSTS